MCKIKLQNYVMIFYESILMNTMSYQIIKEKKKSQNMIVRNYFLKHIIMMTCLKMKNRLIKRNLYLTCHH